MNASQSYDARTPLPDNDAEKADQKRKWHQRFSKLFSRDDGSASGRQQLLTPPPSVLGLASTSANNDTVTKSQDPRRFSRQVIPGLPRPATFRRQMSEKRERLAPNAARGEEDDEEKKKRAASFGRRRAFSARPALATRHVAPEVSAPAVREVRDQTSPARAQSIPSLPRPEQLPQQVNFNSMLVQRPNGPPTPPPDAPPHITDDASRQGSTTIDIQAELESRWILNLSMHFRDKSPREKFFVTYAETPTRWRRVTVSCDYRNAPPDSLESDLHHLTFQREKSARIYEAIRSSLPDIQFYDTVTNLRLETSADERLHVHVTEDVNEMIPYPDAQLLAHLERGRCRCRRRRRCCYCSSDLLRVPESQVAFVGHMSGFVYKVRVAGETMIKKEIPGPDSVEEFLYEINALHALLGSEHVVQLRGLVLDESQSLLTGVLIDYYEQGPLADLLFDLQGKLVWDRRAKWASQIIQGLGEIHEAGYVQGDFTVSNICVDADDNARIIDVNRRGCPVGWEPPEIARMIESGQRISMYIGVKSDLFQLGMVLWALAMEDDEPERRSRPLRLDDEPARVEVPEWYRTITHKCLDPDPRARPSANKLLALARQPSSLSLARTRRGSSVAEGSRPMTSGEDELLHVPPARRNDSSSSSSSSSPPSPSLSSTSFTRDHQSSLSPGGAFLQPRRRSQSHSRSPPSSASRERPRGRSPARDMTHLQRDWPWEHYAGHRHDLLDGDDAEGSNDGNGAPLEPEIVPIDPTSDSWREIMIDGRAYILHVDSLGRGERERDEDYNDGLEEAGRMSTKASSRSAASRSQKSPKGDDRGDLQDAEYAQQPLGHIELPPAAPEVPTAQDVPPNAPDVPAAESTLRDPSTVMRTPRSSSPPPPPQLPMLPPLPQGIWHVDSGLADMHFFDDKAGTIAEEQQQQQKPAAGINFGLNPPPQQWDDVGAQQPTAAVSHGFFHHQDSGLGDMDLDLAGVGGNEMLCGDQQQQQQYGHQLAPERRHWALQAPAEGLADVQEEASGEQKTVAEENARLQVKVEAEAEAEVEVEEAEPGSAGDSQEWQNVTGMEEESRTNILQLEDDEHDEDEHHGGVRVDGGKDLEQGVDTKSTEHNDDNENNNASAGASRGFGTDVKA